MIYPKFLKKGDLIGITAPSQGIKHKEESFDRVILLIRNGTIKCGKYANCVKIDKNPKIKGKEFFKDGRTD